MPDITPNMPIVDDSTQEFWDGARRGVLRIKRCTACGRHHYYPRPFCPYCWNDAVEWVDASGHATLYTYSVVRQNDMAPFRDRIPYVVAIVDLDEGVRMETNIVGCPLDALEVGMKLVVEFQLDESTQFVLPRFTRA